MRNFKDLNVIPVELGFSGDKIKIQKIVDKPITVHNYKVVDSKFEKGSGKCLHLQIEFEEQKRVVFTGSSNLRETILQIPKSDMPFTTTIKLHEERLMFT